MSHYPEPDSAIRDKAKVALVFSNYTAKCKLKNTRGIDTSSLAARSNFIPLKAGVDKLDMNKLVNVWVLVFKLVWII